MLLHDLGYRDPTKEELRSACEQGSAAPPTFLGKDFKIPATVLSAAPLISYSGSVPKAPLGVASIVAKSFRSRLAWFLLSPTWSIAEENIVEQIRCRAVTHRARYPQNALIFICNAPEEVEALRRNNEAAFFYNKTANIPESIFRPLSDAAAEFDAIYNARLVPLKRHELSLTIKSCTFLYYRSATDPDSAQTEAAIIERHRTNAPGHVFVNQTDDRGKPVRLGPSLVNEYLNRAAVGLCLSEVEGAMYASAEYLLAGLPVVTTPSRGGRSVYYDNEYCITVPPDPKSVAEAVYALKAKRIPRSYIRAKTIARIEKDRWRFLDLVNGILSEEHSDRRLTMPWPFNKAVLMEWLWPADAAARATYGIVDAFEQRSTSYYRRRKWLKMITGL